MTNREKYWVKLLEQIINSVQKTIVIFFCKQTANNTLLTNLFFNDTTTTKIYTLSLHDALPISPQIAVEPPVAKPRFSSTQPPKTCAQRSEEHTSELQSQFQIVCRLQLEKKNTVKFRDFMIDYDKP